MKNTNLSISLSVARREYLPSNSAYLSFALTVALVLMSSLPAKADLSRTQAAAILAAEGNAWAAVSLSNQELRSLIFADLAASISPTAGEDGTPEIDCK
ncbi:MAG TPA: hypothetical protein VFF39_08215 [Verrucomicrobiae bacterium]|nr:hypothetical protein [Verrucomicrobiae bacterium]